ncbi:nuclease [Lithohypha guttulata]|uniref:Endonuclease n=1 Tax=Lithohypha guttulata TaxID=1690604 RepID=A0AAN7T0S4_9EURO|nr:nuclease [Lithohypha guttulata]
MSKTTLGLIAAGSAAAGASITALIFSSRSSTPITTPASTIPAPAPLTSGFPAPQPVLTPVPQPLPSTTLPLAPVNPPGVLKYGLTPAISDTSITPSHLAAYNRMTRNPHWVAEHFTPQSLSLNNASRRNSVFYEDAAIPPMFRAKLSDYFRSGYDRGHQVPAADAKWSQDAMDSTFVLSNMCPQVGDGFNRDYWAHFEDFCRNLTKSYPSVRVVTGPLYLPKQYPDGKWRVSYEVIGNPPNVAVPTHFYKVIYGEESLHNPTCKVALGAFVLPNTEIPNSKSLRDFEVPLEAVERASGLIFADKLPIERRKKLCSDINCEIMVREFDRVKQQRTALNAGQIAPAQIAQESRRW